jgi:hypothetical protein
MLLASADEDASSGGNGATVDQSNDVKVLTELNEQFVDAFRKGSWELLQGCDRSQMVRRDGR